MKKLFFASLALFSLTAAFAQPKRVVADKILGIVGDQIILYSDIQNTIADIKRQGGQLPSGAECTIFEQALVSKMLMLQAQKDSLVVTDEEVEADLDLRIRDAIRSLGTQEALEQVAGKTIYQLKDDARQSVLERKLAEAMQRKILENVRITPNEVAAYFNRIPKDSLPFFESEVEVCQIIVIPKASRDLEEYTYAELANIRRQIEDKKITFENAVKRWSEDPGSKDRGGIYQVNRNEKTWDPAFLRACFTLKEGEMSPIIKSKFGYHIIKMEQRSGDDALVRHILKVPAVTDDEVKEAVARLDSVRSRIIAGTTDFNSAAFKYSDDESAKFQGPCVISDDGDTRNRIDELDKEIVAQLGRLKVGEISQPIPYVNERQNKAVRLIYLRSRSEPHVMNLRDDYNRISSAALEEKKYQALEKWINNNIANYYIKIDQEEGNCPQLNRWMGKTDLASRQ